MSRARIIVLVGPKGAGKTTLGRFLEIEPGVQFLEVERIAKRVLAEMGGTIDERYARRAFDEIAAAIDDLAERHDRIVIETTGAAAETPRFLADLGRRHDVRLVRVRAAPETCAARIAGRDPSHQIAVPTEMVLQMHARTEALSLPWDLDVVNDPSLTRDETRAAFEPLLRR